MRKHFQLLSSDVSNLYIFWLSDAYVIPKYIFFEVFRISLSVRSSVAGQFVLVLSQFAQFKEFARQRVQCRNQSCNLLFFSLSVSRIIVPQFKLLFCSCKSILVSEYRCVKEMKIIKKRIIQVARKILITEQTEIMQVVNKNCTYILLTVQNFKLKYIQPT